MQNMKFFPYFPQAARRNRVSKPIVILVRPEQGGNIGSTMRAMANFGLEELRLVQPVENWMNFDCVRFAMGAMEKLKTLRVCRSLYEALADIQMSYALTVRSRKDMIKDNITPCQAMKDAIHFTDRWAFVFGNEVTGLDNQSVALCNEIITIPTNHEFSSLNLSQAVVVCCYAWHAVAGNATVKNTMLKSLPHRANVEKVHYMLCRIYQQLKENKLLANTPNGLEITMQSLQNLFMRVKPTDKEISLIYRITNLGKSSEEFLSQRQPKKSAGEAKCESEEKCCSGSEKKQDCREKCQDCDCG